MYVCLPFKSGSKVKLGGIWSFVAHGEVLTTQGEKELLDSLTLLKENRRENKKGSLPQSSLSLPVGPPSPCFNSGVLDDRCGSLILGSK